MTTCNIIPSYHPYNDIFINDPSSFKFKFTCVGDIITNEIHRSFEATEACVHTKPVKSNKKKKKKNYPTNPRTIKT